MTKPFTVVYASDNRGVEPLGVSLFSLLENAAEGTIYHVVILSKDITEQNQNRLSGIAQGEKSRHSIVFKSLSDFVFPDYLPIDHRSIMIWARIFIPDLLSEETGVILYLDIDTLVCDDLTPVFATDLKGKAIGVVLEAFSAIGSTFNSRLDIPLSSVGYFNSGVLLMDVTVFRQQNLAYKTLECAQIYKSVILTMDQDALNAALHDNYVLLHPRWNWHDGRTRMLLKYIGASPDTGMRGNSIHDSVEAILRPGILHFFGDKKPWHYNYRAEGKRYADVLRRSGFGQYPLPGKTWKKRLKAMMYKPVYALGRHYARLLDKRFHPKQAS
jgi:lipopolysaccharide biosynthesis glycosyltransferase